MKNHSNEWKLINPKRMNEWKRRGEKISTITDENGNIYRLTDEQLNCLIRCHPTDGMNGFFVAIFMKIKSNNKTDNIITKQIKEIKHQNNDKVDEWEDNEPDTVYAWKKSQEFWRPFSIFKSF